MSNEDFIFNREDEAAIIAAIKKAESKTSGEIKVHIEPTLEKDPHERALEVFHLLKMKETKLSNGILFYVAVESKTIVIYGDQGIDNVLPKNSWEDIIQRILNYFKASKFKDGLIHGITLAGDLLATHFPISDNDINELSNEISR